MAATPATRDVALVSARPQSAKAPSASRDLYILHPGLSMTCLKPNTSAHDSAAACSSAVHTCVRNSATKAHAALVVKPFSTRSVAAVDVQFCSRLCHAVPNHRLADTLANARRLAGIRKYPTTAIKMMRPVPNARSLWRNDACAGRRPSRINSAGCKMFAVEMFVVTSFAVVRISVANPATDQESVKMRTVKLASRPAASRRRRAGIPMRTCAMLRSLARKRSHAKARFSSRATAKRRSRR